MGEPQYRLEGIVHTKSEVMEDFEGPLDVIFELLSKNKIEIQDVSITAILEQYLAYLEKLYATGPRQLRQLRQLYRGDNLRFYREFVEANHGWFQGSLDDLEAKLSSDPLELVLNLVRRLDHPKAVQLEGLLTLAYRTKQVSASKEDLQLRDTYSFNYVDLSMKKPIEEYGPGKTDILLAKVNGKFEFKVLQIHWA